MTGCTINVDTHCSLTFKAQHYWRLDGVDSAMRRRWIGTIFACQDPHAEGEASGRLGGGDIRSKQGRRRRSSRFQKRSARAGGSWRHCALARDRQAPSTEAWDASQPECRRRSSSKLGFAARSLSRSVLRLLFLGFTGWSLGRRRRARDGCALGPRRRRGGGRRSAFRCGRGRRGGRHDAGVVTLELRIR
jgi:hypothetical protein